MPGLDAEILDEGVSGRAVGVERIGLPAGAIEREEQLAHKALTRRVIGDERLELRDELDVAASLEVAVDAVLDRGESKLLEARNLVLREAVICNVGKRCAPPESERLLNASRSPERVEAVEVELARVNTQQVAGCLGRDALGAEQLPQLRDVPLQRLARSRCRLLLPERVDQSIARDDAVRLQQEQREQRALLLPTQVEREPVRSHLERAEKTELVADPYDATAPIPPAKPDAGDSQAEAAPRRRRLATCCRTTSAG